MTGRWGLLFVAAVVAGLGATLLARAPHDVAPPVAEVAAPAVTVHVMVERDRVTCVPDAVPGGVPVAITIENRSGIGARVRLAGYADRVDTGALAPGATWSGTFRADRPGDDFAWLVGDEPRGRFGVTGSHLVEGHR